MNGCVRVCVTGLKVKCGSSSSTTLVVVVAVLLLCCWCVAAAAVVLVSEASPQSYRSQRVPWTFMPGN